MVDKKLYNKIPDLLCLSTKALLRITITVQTSGWLAILYIKEKKAFTLRERLQSRKESGWRLYIYLETAWEFYAKLFQYL